ncbi:MAG: YggS family pyridoxal phosphate-dependent enzyme [Desulfuromonadaceae bacterium]|nr:YggS family pyridoxal phosphate-dependent enzyme [Desulfuromonadaceae bacterium]MDD2854040.1 YggS family pyridoxal phosphate-dependent enzyme [Desulfuromonadaceae bacterium]
MAIPENIEDIRKRITLAAEKAGRDSASVRLVAVSKTRSISEIIDAFNAGQSDFGENYIQELIPKLDDIHEPVNWHVIGSLQSNKVKYIAGRVSLIHSVDRISLAEEINRQWQKLDKVCDVLVQVNISGESTKSGTNEDGAIQLVKGCSNLKNIRVRGLMTMPPFFDDPEKARPYFAELRRLSETIAALEISGVEMAELSMGMSGDFEAAIEEGATLVRIGTAIFGER